MAVANGITHRHSAILIAEAHQGAANLSVTPHSLLLEPAALPKLQVIIEISHETETETEATETMIEIEIMDGVGTTVVVVATPQTIALALALVPELAINLQRFNKPPRLR